MNKKKIGSNLREIRKKRKMSQVILAEEAGLNRTYIGEIERGEKNMSLNTMSKLAKALKIEITDLFNPK